MATAFHSDEHWSENARWRTSIDRGGGKGGWEAAGEDRGELKNAKIVLTLYATHAAFNEALIESDRYGVNKYKACFRTTHNLERY